LSFPSLERLELDGLCVDVAFGADGEVVDCASRKFDFVGGGFEPELGLHGSEVLDVDGCELIAVFLADGVCKLGPCEVDLEVETSWIVEVLDGTVREM
jgi:hypothetical protein